MQGFAALRILIVEDEGIIADDIASRLKRAGYEVTAIAASAEEVFAGWRESRPDLILMDIHIDGPMDGIQTAARLRETSDIPIVFLSAHADRETMGRAEATGAFAFVTKPIQSVKLMTAIEEAAQRHRGAGGDRLPVRQASS